MDKEDYKYCYEIDYFNNKSNRFKENNFKDATINFLRKEIKKNPYEDPDSYERKTNSKFYKDMTAFLNGKFKSKTKLFVYKGENDGIQFTCKNSKDKKLILRTDQFGFSFNGDKAFNINYPYGKFLNIIQKEKNETQYNNDLDFIVDCVMKTRTIGGCFIWPINEDLNRTQYNRYRGNNTYIEDRVDLTLLEIKKYYEYLEKKIDEKELKKLIIYKYLKNDKDNIEIWLKSFGSFKDFVDILCFEDNFVIKNKEGNYEIIDIVLSDVKNNKMVPLKDKNETKKIKDIKDKESLKRVLSNVSILALERTKKM